MTLMFCAFEGRATILRLYGQAQTFHPRDLRFLELLPLFPTLPGTRQIFELKVDLVQTSCGFAVPFFEYKGERDELNQWVIRKGEEGLRQSQLDKNQHSIDGKPTGIFE